MQCKRILPSLLSLISLYATAQGDGGMNFIKANSWAEVKAKAKAENKYIFLDGYTTWCGPCIMMAKKIFPLPEVGAFYNANFINVKVQLDTTTRDDDYVKMWYKDGHHLMETYNIRAFPTYLFFSPDGEVVHRAIGASDAETFINKGRDALEPDKQYYRLSSSFSKGNRDPEFLKKLIAAATASWDKQNIPLYARAYYATQTDLLTEENMKLLVDLTESPSDTGFYLMAQYPEKFNEMLGQPYASQRKVMAIIMTNDVFPHLSARKELVKNDPDWEQITTDLTKKYSSLGEMAVLNGKAMYYRAKSDYVKFSESVSALLKNHEKILEAEMLNEYAWDIFENCNDGNCIRKALAWSKTSIEKSDDPNFIDTYANLLHKSGDTPNAIIWQKKAIELQKGLGEDTADYEETLAKMERGQKTW